MRIVDVMWSSYLHRMLPSFFRFVLGAPARDDDTYADEGDDHYDSGDDDSHDAMIRTRL